MHRFFYIFSILLFQSCSSDTETLNEGSSFKNENSSVIFSSDIIDNDITNDTVISPGKFHNIIVLDIIKNSGVSMDDDMETNIENIVQYYEERYYTFTLPYSYMEFNSPEHGLNLLAENDLVSSDFITIVENDYVNLQNANNQDEFLSIVDNMEQSYLNYNLSEEEEKIYKAALSVLRYSFDLWTTATLSQGSETETLSRGGINGQIVIMSDWTACVYSAAVSGGNPAVALGAAAVGSAGSALWQSIFYQVPVNDFNYLPYSPNIKVEW